MVRLNAFLFFYVYMLVDLKINLFSILIIFFGLSFVDDKNDNVI